MKNLKSNFLHSMIWTVGSNFGGFLINFFLGVLLARTLGPESYGLLGMILVITGFGRLFMDFGFGEALIQRQDVDQKDYSSVFWFNVIISFFLVFLFFISASTIAKFYEQPILKPISKVISFVFLLNALGIIQRVKLEKELKFKYLGITELLSSLISILVALYFAYIDYGVWALVILHLVKPFAYLVGIWCFSNWLPSLVLSKQSLVKLSGFSFSLLLNGLMETIASTADKLLIGKFIGSSELGIYSKATATVRLPVMQIMSAISRVIYPTLSAIQNEKQRIFGIYKKFIRLLSIIIYPIMVLFYFFGSEIVLFLFGDKWSQMIPIFKIIAITAGFIPFNILMDNIIKSSGSSKYLNIVTFSEKPIIIFSIILGIYIGNIYSVTVALSTAVFIVFIIKSYVTYLSLEASFFDLLKEHFISSYFVIIPITILIIIGLIPGFEMFSIKLGFTVISFLISFFLIYKSIMLPMLNFIKTFR